MISPRYLRFLVPVVLCALIGCGGSPTEVSNGGTHTGNPEINASVSAIKMLYRAVEEQNIHSYIDTATLNPVKLISGGLQSTHGPTLAKKCVSEYSTTAVDTLFRLDTLLIVDTAYVNDTIIYRNFRTDTIINTTEWGREEILVYKSIIDSIVITDTILSVDSLFLADTIYLSDTIESGVSDGSQIPPILETSPWGYNLVSANQRYAYTTMNRDYITHVFEVEGDTVMINVDPARYSITYEAAVNIHQLEKMVERQDFRTHLSYTDRDGDSLLFLATLGRPKILLNQDVDSAGYTTKKSVLFDHGFDFDFTTVVDNAVRAFTCNRLHRQDTIVKASWEMMRDSGMLSVVNILPADSIESVEKRYTYEVHQEQPLGIVQAHQTVHWHIGSIHKVVLTVSPKMSWSSDRKPNSADISGIVYLRDGSRCDIVGSIENALFNGALHHADGSTTEIEDTALE